MKLFYTILAFCLLLGMNMLVSAAGVVAELDKVFASRHQGPANVSRDIYRHPKETLIPTSEILKIALRAYGFYRLLSVKKITTAPYQLVQATI